MIGLMSSAATDLPIPQCGGEILIVGIDVYAETATPMGMSPNSEFWYPAAWNSLDDHVEPRRCDVFRDCGAGTGDLCVDLRSPGLKSSGCLKPM
jgi:hypothetical protein